ncbi:hypothetical protein ABBQ38_003639 [Trebouxia sp. C0009 RCD-2024]
MGWSEEVHDSRVTTAVLQAKREARLRRAHKIPEVQGNSGGWPLAAVAGLVLSAAALQQGSNWRRATHKLQHFWRQVSVQGNQEGRKASGRSGTRSLGPSSRDQTATASSSGRAPLPAVSAPSQQKKQKNKKRKGRRH